MHLCRTALAQTPPPCVWNSTTSSAVYERGASMGSISTCMYVIQLCIMHRVDRLFSAPATTCTCSVHLGICAHCEALNVEGKQACISHRHSCRSQLWIGTCNIAPRKSSLHHLLLGDGQMSPASPLTSSFHDNIAACSPCGCKAMAALIWLFWEEQV